MWWLFNFHASIYFKIELLRRNIYNTELHTTKFYVTKSRLVLCVTGTRQKRYCVWRQKDSTFISWDRAIISWWGKCQEPPSRESYTRFVYSLAFTLKIKQNKKEAIAFCAMILMLLSILTVFLLSRKSIILIFQDKSNSLWINFCRGFRSLLSKTVK